MSSEYRLSHGLGEIVNEVESVALDAAQQPKISNYELSEILSFLAKVSQVVEQAFRDVLDILIEIKLLRPQDLSSDRIYKLSRKIEMVMARSHYRDAVEICSRLKHLKEFYLSDLAQLIDPLPGRQGWSGLMGLIEDREGRILMLINEVMWNIQKQLNTVNTTNISEMKVFASSQSEVIKGELHALSDFTNRILGLSGRPGLLELVRHDSPRATVLGEMSVVINQGKMDMSKSYSVGQGVLLGENATARDIRVDQAWQIQAHDLPALASELSRLRQEMKKLAAEPEEDVAVGQVAIAEKAAKDGDPKGVSEALKGAGKWALSVAEKIGVGVATQALKSALGL
jgi:hypothetical protein